MISQDEAMRLEERCKILYEALDEALKLMRHYAGLLNAYDEGRRRIPDGVQGWIERINKK